MRRRVISAKDRYSRGDAFLDRESSAYIADVLARHHRFLPHCGRRAYFLGASVDAVGHAAPLIKTHQMVPERDEGYVACTNPAARSASVSWICRIRAILPFTMVNVRRHVVSRADRPPCRIGASRHFRSRIHPEG